MNTVYHINKLAGICFAVGLSAFMLHRAYVWRQEMSKQARITLKERLEEMSKDPRYQLPVSDFKLPETPFMVQEFSA
jgi:hypothetical protein